MTQAEKPRVLLLATTTGYQTQRYVEAAEKLGCAVVLGTDRCHVLEDPWQDAALPLRFERAEEAAVEIVDFARAKPLSAILAAGDRPTPTAARAAQALGLLSHPPEAADICRDKYRSRERLREVGLNVPEFTRFQVDADPREALAVGDIEFPCVLKPLALSASRGVIRANNPQEFVAAFDRIRALLRSPDVGVLREETSNFIQVEAYIEGQEIAVEGTMERGRLRLLAIFDKPDPLEGPYFEETIYTTPSRLAGESQQQVVQALTRAVGALGLYHGPLHAELRINSAGVWVLEIAARSIGGLCSKALRFRIPLVDENVSLEELLIRLALGMDVSRVFREDTASGVMMIPIPQAGFYQETHGIEQAWEIPGVEEVTITAKSQQKLVPLPEGASYLGFIFARGRSPSFVEDALRRAHEKLSFVLTPELPIVRSA
jgi:biotin carboxylase